jgi:type II secretory pathway pseudopilin PulG
MSRTRPGASLVELLIVMAAIGLLIGLLLPAVSRVREAASRAACQNNLRQIGVAWQGQLADYGHFPTNGTQDGVQFLSVGQPAAAGNVRTSQRCSWLYQILPQMGEEATWRQADAPSVPEAVRRAAAQPVRGYFCPTRGRPMTFRADLNNPGSPALAGNDYAANGGDWWPATGVFAYYWRLSLRRPPLPILTTAATYSDGLSVTVFVSERRMSAVTVPDPDLYQSGGYMEGSESAFTAAKNPRKNIGFAPLPDSTPPLINQDSNAGGSPHAAGPPALFGDGSVRTIPFSIDPGVWLSLCRRSDGGPAGAEF